MRISDWSSDVCSSDLARLADRAGRLIDVRVDRGEHRLRVGVGFGRAPVRVEARAGIPDEAVVDLERVLPAEEVEGSGWRRSRQRAKRLAGVAGEPMDSALTPHVRGRKDRKSTRLNPSH